jgi:penicillin-binding protein 1A
MTNNSGRGKTPPRRKKKLKLKTGRLLLGLLAVFLFISLVAAFATYRIVSAYMTDVPELDPAKFIFSATSFIYDKDGVEVTRLLGEENRIQASLDEISPHLINAFIAIEDDRFYEHSGFDIRGIMRAAYQNFIKSSVTQGGSTITQQFVKNAFFSSEKTIKRKVQELYLAYQLERQFTKDEILEFYLNRIFFDFNAYGVEAAAQTYFSKSAADVTLAEAALLAGIPNLPGKYSPYRNKEESINRQIIILARMQDLGMITREEAREARNEEIVLSGPPLRNYPYPYFIEYVIHDQVVNILSTIPEHKDNPYDLLYKGGVKIYTTLDQNIQRVAEETINNDSLYPKTVTADGKPQQPQSAVIVADPKTGHLSAIVGGRHYSKENQDNRATRAKRQAGSVLKPIVVYAPAFEEGLAVPGTVLDDSPGSWPQEGNKDWYPENYSNRFLGLVTTRYALIHSLNIPAVRLLEQLGVDKGLEYAQKMGISTFIHPAPGRQKHDQGLSIVLGGLTDGLRVIDAAQAFSVLANQGVRTDFTAVLKIEDRNGKVIYEHKPVSEQVLKPESAYLTTSILQDVVRVGTAARLKINRPVAAKTGTSDKARDGWLAAYTPDYVAVFWIGYDYNDGEIYQPWTITPKFLNPIMLAAHEGLLVKDFVRPDSISNPIAICSKSGKRPGPFCPPEHIVSDYFPHNQIPNEICDMHIQMAICTESGLLATEFCPPHTIVKKVFLNRPEYLTTDDNWRGTIGRVPADAKLMPPTEICNIHTTPPLGQPLNPTAVYNPQGNSIQLTWQSGGGQTAGYLVYRKAPDDEDYKPLLDEPVNTFSLVDTAHVQGKYSYRIYAVDPNGVRSKPTTVSVSTNGETIVEPAPPETGPEPGDTTERGNNSRSNDKKKD